MTIRVLTIARGGSRSQTGPVPAPPRWGVATTMRLQPAQNPEGVDTEHGRFHACRVADPPRRLTPQFSSPSSLQIERLEVNVSDGPGQRPGDADAPAPPPNFPNRRKRSAAQSSSAFWRPLEASESPLVRLGQAVLPSGWALLLAGVLLAWRLLAAVARGDLTTAPPGQLLVAVIFDVALAHGLTSFVRLLAVATSSNVVPDAAVVRRSTFVLAGIWFAITMLRIAAMVHAALDHAVIEPAFWQPILANPSSFFANGALWAVLAAAAATAGLARYCLTCDMEIAQALDIAEPRGKLLGLTALAWALTVSVTGAVAWRATSLPAKSVAQVPELQAGVALWTAWQADALQRKED